MSLQAAIAAIGELVEETVGAELEELQVVTFRWFNPTPPCIDLYPGDPSVEQRNYGYEQADAFVTVRARVLTIDTEAGQNQLVEMIDPTSALSVGAAISSDRSLKGTAQNVLVETCSGGRLYEDVAGGPALYGCEWRVRVVL